MNESPTNREGREEVFAALWFGRWRCCAQAGELQVEEGALGGAVWECERVWSGRPAGRLEGWQWGKGGQGKPETHFKEHILKTVDRISVTHTIYWQFSVCWALY